MGMVAAGDALCVPGNHENKLRAGAARAATCRSRTGSPSRSSSWRRSRRSSGRGSSASSTGWCRTTCSTAAALVVAHAGLIERYQGRASGAGALVLPVRRDHGRDRRVRAAGALPVGAGVPRPGDGALRAHAGARAGVGQQHALPRHRLRVRRPAHRAALPGAGARLGAGARRVLRAGPAVPGRPCRESRGSAGRRPAAVRRRRRRHAGRRDPELLDLDDVLGRPGRRDRPPRADRRAGGERRRRAGGDEPVRGRPALAAATCRRR